MGFFPNPYPGELLYGVAARYLSLTRYPSQQTVLAEWFGSAKAAAVIDLPGHLDRLVNEIPRPHPYTAETIIKWHSLFPVYSRFLSVAQAARAIDDMRSGSALSVKTRLGTLATKVKGPKCLRVCPECVREDIRLYGEAYWHRVHQATGVEVCPTHHVFLEDTVASATNRQCKHALVTVPEHMDHLSPQRIKPESRFDRLLLDLAQDAQWLLDHPALQPIGLDRLHHKYMKLLYQRGFASIGGRVSITDLTEALTLHYGRDLLKQFGCDLKYSERHSHWLTRLTQQPRRAQHPLHHMLLFRFLGYSAERFFLEEPTHPFGTGPWPCLNPASSHYRQMVVTSCHVRREKRTGRLQGTFCCTCGYIYTRWGPDETSHNLFEKTRVKVFGAEWEGQLRALWTSGLGIKAISRRLAADPNTIRRYLNKPTGSTGRFYTSVLSERHERYRDLWTALRKEHPTASRSELAAMRPAVARWLRKHDREWLEANSPPHLVRCPRRGRVDRIVRDIS